jgi:AcrR family transcriptional regulator
MKGSPDADTVPARALAAAAFEIRQIGPKRMTVSGIAGRLGMSHANLYRHFADKTALIDAVLAQSLRAIEARLLEIADGPDPADDKLERFLSTLTRAYDELLVQDVAIFRLLAEPVSDAQEPERHRKRVVSLIGRIIEEGIITHLIAGQDARRATTLLLDLVHRFVDPSTLLGGQVLDPVSDGRRDRAVRAAIRALTTRR